MAALPSHEELAGVLATLRLGVHPSDLHGSLTGYLCAGGLAGDDDWLERLELAPGDADAGQHAALRALLAAARAQFEQDPARVMPLLPVRGAPLARRADALVEWCRGFLGGFGLVGTTLRAHLSDDATEILADLGTIAGSRLEVGGGKEDEQAFTDVLDFVRTATAVLHRETSAGRRTARSLH
ncbi:UPF0149 family protein [Dokdonella fugitiva]|uniref:UPF0149 family protein n=1 Tax=Dokdonella fugitiva TaxID=328517 RepID=UPI0015F7EB8A|nr:UPF0149 family protein [Dokdonella fugitiva]MBA8882196.1 hypothetical protein [Dokdonella fugitiva]